MKLNKLYWLLMLLCVAFSILIVINFVKLHEHLHQNIYTDYGINSTISYHWNVATTTPNETQYYLCDEQCKLQQNMVEIVGYNTQSLISAVIFFSLIIIALLTAITIILIVK